VEGRPVAKAAPIAVTETTVAQTATDVVEMIDAALSRIHAVKEGVSALILL
jgi:hypothetical protein